MPNIFGRETANERAIRLAWEAEYDRRLNDPTVRKDKMNNGLNPFRPSEARVADDAGTMRRRSGEGCCGCGKWSSETFTAAPEWDNHHHGKDHHHEEDHRNTDDDD